MTIIVFLFMFLLGDLIGYAFEVLFRRFFSAHKWVNPGFMRGPWLPLYGFGLVVMMSLVMLTVGLLPESMPFYNPIGNMVGHKGQIMGPTVYDLIPLLLMWVSLILLEFIAGLIFVKGFKIKLWDYSNMKGNVLGIICPVFSVVWLVAAVVYYYALSPFVLKLFQGLFDYLYGANGDPAHFSFLFVFGIVYGIFLIDLVQSLGIFTKVVKLAHRQKVLLGYESFIRQGRQAVKEKRQEILQNVIPESVLKDMNRQSEDRKENIGKVLRKVRQLILIDPDKTKSQNYGKDGRPIHTDDEK